MEHDVLDDQLGHDDKVYIQATQGKRFANYVIDQIVSALAGIVIFVAIGFSNPAFIESISENTIFDRIIGMVIYGVVMVAQEIIFNGRSIGKFITNTRVVMEDGSPLTTQTLVQRNLSRIVPFEALSYISSVN